MDNKELEMAKEVARIYPQKKDYKEAYREVVEQYKEAHNSTDQSKSYEPNTKILNAILTDKVEIDNGDLYFEGIGETIGEL